MIYVTYDSGLSYPQNALFGLGVASAEGHTPPAGLDSFGVDESVLTYGIDERFYEVQSSDVLILRDASVVDAMKAEDLLSEAVALKYAEADAYAQDLIADAYDNPVQGTTVDGVQYEKLVNSRRKDKADKLAGEIALDQAEKDEAKTDQKLSEYENKTQTANDKARTEINKGNAAAEVLAMDIPTITTWPIWSAPV